MKVEIKGKSLTISLFLMTISLLYFLKSSLFSVRLYILIALLITLFGCTKPAIIPVQEPGILKQYDRVSMLSINSKIKTNIEVSDGDYLLIIAYGNVQQKAHSSLIENYLFMGIGDNEELVPAVYPPNNINFVKVKKSGNLKFQFTSPLGPKQINFKGTGSVIIDVFLFSDANGADIINTLHSIAENNKSDKKLYPKLNHLVGDYQSFENVSKFSESKSKSAKTYSLKDNRFLSKQVSGAERSNNDYIRNVLQMGHIATILSSAISPNEKYVVSGSDDHTIRLWEVSTGRETRVFRGHEDSVTSVLFSPDGKYIVSGSVDKTIRLWQRDTGKEIVRLDGHDSSVNSISFHPNGKQVISGSDDNTVRLWDIDTGKQLKKFTGHSSPVNTVVIEQNGKYAASGSWDRTIQIWDIATGDRIAKHGKFDSNITSISFSPDGKKIVFGCDDGSIEIIDIISGRTLSNFIVHDQFTSSVAYDPGGQFVLSSNLFGDIYLWDVKSGKELKKYVGHSNAVRSICFSSKGRFLLSSGNDRTIRLWHVLNGREVMKFRGFRNSINSISFSNDGVHLLIGSDDQVLRVWNTKTGRDDKNYSGHKDNLMSVSFSPDGQYAISASKDGSILRWDLSRPSGFMKLRNGNQTIRSVQYRPNTEDIASLDSNGVIEIWDSSSKDIKRTWDLRNSYAESIQFSRDGKYIFAASDTHFNIWDIETGGKIEFKERLFDALAYTATALSISSDNQFAITGTTEGDILLWEIRLKTRSRRLIKILQGHKGPITDLLFSHGGQHIISAGEDGAIRLWEVLTGKEIFTFRGHTGKINSIAINNNGTFLASAGEDCSVRLWNLETGLGIVAYYRSPDGEWILSTPDGYYTCSPEGSPLLYYILPNKTETYSFEQFETLYKRPDIIRSRLRGDLIKESLPEIIVPPTIEMPDHLEVRETSEKKYSIEVHTSDIDVSKTLRVFNNGKPIKEIHIDGPRNSFTISVPLYSGANRITAIAFNDQGISSNPKWLDIICNAIEISKQNLHLLSIGISRYPNLPSQWQLDFAHTDARNIREAFLRNEGKLFNNIHSILLTDEQATINEIKKTLENLSETNEDDIVIIFLAGHGVRDQEGTFYFLTSDSMAFDFSRGVINWNLIGEYLAKIKGRVILLLDACHSGSISTDTVVPNDELAGSFFANKRSGVMVFSAAKGGQYSMESPDFGNGAGIFTYALIQGLSEESEKADSNSNGYVELMELVDHVTDFVDSQTRGGQTPWLSRKELFGDLAISKVN